jgi:hypothetical protein
MSHLCWSSGKWSKARGRATVGRDQVGLDSYVGPGNLSLGGSAVAVKKVKQPVCE